MNLPQSPDEAAMELMQSVYRVSGPRVIFENIEGELILVHMERGTYFSTDEVGAFIWSLIEARSSGREIARALEARYEESAEGIAGALSRFLVRLRQEELVAVEPAPEASLESTSIPATTERRPFTAPVLQAYHDMQDMLSLDPIHDVEAAGWPVPKLDEDPNVTSAA